MTYNLEERYGDIEISGKLSVPDNSDVSHEKRP